MHKPILSLSVFLKIWRDYRQDYAQSVPYVGLLWCGCWGILAGVHQLVQAKYLGCVLPCSFGDTFKRHALPHSSYGERIRLHQQRKVHFPFLPAFHRQTHLVWCPVGNTMTT
jgi:hypothetical protein